MIVLCVQYVGLQYIILFNTITPILYIVSKMFGKLKFDIIEINSLSVESTCIVWLFVLTVTNDNNLSLVLNRTRMRWNSVVMKIITNMLQKIVGILKHNIILLFLSSTSKILVGN